MNDQEAERYNGPTYRCSQCGERHPLDGSEECVPREDSAEKDYDGDEETRWVDIDPYPRDEERGETFGTGPDEPILGGQEVSKGARRDDEPEDTGFEWVQDEDLPDEVDYHEPRKIVAHMIQGQIENLRGAPCVDILHVTESSDVSSTHKQVAFTIPVEVPR